MTAYSTRNLWLTKNFPATAYPGSHHSNRMQSRTPGCPMLEPIMFSSIGFLTACLLMVAFVPVIHERAVRLTARRFQAAAPRVKISL